MIINVCLNDNTAERAFRKTDRFCSKCAKPFLKVSVYTNIDEHGKADIVTEIVRDDPSVLEKP